MSKVKLLINKGSTFRFPFYWEDHLGNSHIPTAQFRCHFRESVESDVILLDLTTENGGFEKGQIDGREVAYMYISDTQTSGITLDTGVYDVEGIIPSGDVVRLFEGSVKFSPEVTR